MPPKTRAGSAVIKAVAANGSPTKKRARKASVSSDSDFEATSQPKPKRNRKPQTNAVEEVAAVSELVLAAPVVDWSIEVPKLLPAELSFSLEDANNHLIRVDSRFEDIFDRLRCRPFVKLERVEPFRTLTTSIMYVSYNLIRLSY